MTDRATPAAPDDVADLLPSYNLIQEIVRLGVRFEIVSGDIALTGSQLMLILDEAGNMLSRLSTRCMELEARNHTQLDLIIKEQAQLVRLEGVIAENNKRCERECADYQCGVKTIGGSQCGYCPRRYMIEVPK